jgi:hypothetical protein
MYIQADNGKFYNKPIFVKGDVFVEGTSVKVILTPKMLISHARARISEALKLLGLVGKVAVHGSATKTFLEEKLVDAYEFEWAPTQPIVVPKSWTGMCSISIPVDAPQICFWYYFPYRELMDIIGGLRESRRLISLWGNGTASRDFTRWVRRQVDYHESLHGLPSGPGIAIYVRDHRFKGTVTSPAFI